MNRLFYVLSLLCFTFLLAAQNNNDSKFYGDLTGNGEVFYNSVLSGIQKGNLEINDTSFWLVDSSIVYFESKKNDCYLSRAYAVKGRIEFKAARFDSATINFIKSSKFLQSECPKINVYYLYNSWALLSKRIKEFDISDSLNGLAYIAASQIEDKTYMLNVLVNKSILYSERNDYPMAIKLMKEVLEKSLEFDITYHKLVSLQNLGAYYIDLEYFDSALYVYEKLDEIIDEDTPPRVIMDQSNNTGLIYYRKGNLAKADIYYKKAIDLARLNEELGVLLIYLANYSDLKYDQGEYQISMDYLTEYLTLKDSLFNAEKFEIVKNLETKYKTSKQREKILELEKQSLAQSLEIEHNTKNRNTLLFILAGFVFAIVSLYARMRYIKKSKRLVEKQKKRSEELLLNILPEEVAEELKLNGSSPAKDFLKASVLFTDFKDFTQLSEKMGAQELVEEINFFFKAFDTIVMKYGIEKIKTIGDAYMAASGVPKSETGDEKRLVLAALEMLAVTNKRNAEYQEQNKPRFDIRIGIHTGPLVAGIVGIKKFQYDIWGDTVNTAARMETSCDIGMVNISQSTYDLVKDEKEFVFTQRGLIDAKGKGQLHMYYVSLKEELE